MKELDKAIDGCDLPGLIASWFPESGAAPGRAGLYLATWRNEVNRSFSVYRKRGGGCWMWRDHGEGQSGNAMHFLTVALGWPQRQALAFLLGGKLPADWQAPRYEPDPQALKKARTERRGKRGRVVCCYNYLDERERLVMQVQRWEPKSFTQRRPAREQGRWIYGLTAGTYLKSPRGDWFLKSRASPRRLAEATDERDFLELAPPLYHLPMLRHAIHLGWRVVLVDGEKDADNLIKRGVFASCVPMGYGNFRPHHAEMLRGAKVVVLKDREKHGDDKAEAIVKSISAVALSVAGPAFAPGEENRDISDFLTRGGDEAVLERFLAEVEQRGS